MTPLVPALSAGVRVAGIVICLGYLTGLVDGSLVAVVGGLALITVGRSLLLERWDGVLAAAALVVAVGALGIAAVRWGELDLPSLRGVQAVLGPTLAVEPDAAAGASSVAAGSAIVAIGLWLGAPRPVGRAGWAWPIGEALVAALAVASVFWGPALPGRDSAGLLAGVGAWIAVVGGVAVVAGGVAVAQARLAPVWRWVALGIAALALFTAAGLIASVR